MSEQNLEHSESQLWRGIGAFLGHFAGTVPPGTYLTIRNHESGSGIAILADGETFAVVNLVDDETRTDLQNALLELYLLGR